MSSPARTGTVPYRLNSHDDCNTTIAGDEVRQLFATEEDVDLLRR